MTDEYIDLPWLGAGMQGKVIPEKGIEFPPDRIFKQHRNRISVSAYTWGNGNASYIPTHAEYIEGKGNFVYYEGKDIPPSRAVAIPQMIAAADPVKRLLIQLLGLVASKSSRMIFLAVGLTLTVSKKLRKSFLDELAFRFVRIGSVSLNPFYLEDGYYSAPVKEIRKFITTFFVGLDMDAKLADELAETVGCLFEYDPAYRWRMQDMMTECNPEALHDNLPKELERLIALESTRENIGANPDVPEKFRKGAFLLKFLWKFPAFKKAIQKAVKGITMSEIRLDELDYYHTYLYGNYNVGGKTLEERMKILESIHGPDPEDWPPRMVIMQKIPVIT
jgi:hypothetical protein